MKGFYLVCFLLSFSLFLWQSVSDARQSVVQRTALLIVIMKPSCRKAVNDAASMPKIKSWRNRSLLIQSPFNLNRLKK